MPHSIHIPEWIHRAQQDYYILFVQAWIPFNAWYKKEIAPSSGDQDRKCINHICQNANTYKNKILSLLNGVDRQSRIFKQELADLHAALLAHSIPDNAEPITFKTTSIYDLSTPVLEGDFYRYHYKVERTGAEPNFHYDIRIEDKNTHAAKYTKNFNRWKMEDLTSDANFIALSDSVKTHTIDLFKRIYPGSPTNVVLDPVDRAGQLCAPPNSICLDEEARIYFIKDVDKIAQVLIQVIYSLRNQIFHGSLNPTDANQEVYKHLYVIQSMLIKELA